jgi:hypothetical protein
MLINNDHDTGYITIAYQFYLYNTVVVNNYFIRYSTNIPGKDG